MAEHGRRPTRQRAAVADAARRDRRLHSAQDLHARLRGDGQTVGLATVYRTLQAMADDGEVDVLRTDDGEAVYRALQHRAPPPPVCRACGRTVEVEGPAVERWADTVSAEHGFSDVRHTLEIFGTCADCAAG